MSTHTLGHGWYANINKDEKGATIMTIRNPDKGQRIDLDSVSFSTLRAILRDVVK